MPTKARLELRLTKERLFYCGMALLVTAAVVIGFGPSWFMRGYMTSARPLSPLAPLVIIHAIAFTAWIALFLAQAGLISARQHKLHMRLGMATVGLAIIIVVLGLLTGARSAAIGSGPPGVPPLTWFANPFLDMVVFSGLVAGGYVYRRDPQTHKRLMLCATLIMLQPSVGRMPFPSTTIFAGELTTLIAFLLATPLLAWDLVQRGRPHMATLIGLGALAAEQLVKLAIWRTETWQEVAGLIVRFLS
jgi:cation transport ATPase